MIAVGLTEVKQIQDNNKICRIRNEFYSLIELWRYEDMRYNSNILKEMIIQQNMMIVQIGAEMNIVSTNQDNKFGNIQNRGMA